MDNLFNMTTDQRGRARIEPSDNALTGSGTDRLAGQNAKILAMLRCGPVKNIDMITVSLKYTSRISEVRSYLKGFGETIVCRDLGKGITEYSIEPWKG